MLLHQQERALPSDSEIRTSLINTATIAWRLAETGKEFPGEAWNLKLTELMDLARNGETLEKLTRTVEVWVQNKEAE